MESSLYQDVILLADDVDMDEGRPPPARKRRMAEKAAEGVAGGDDDEEVATTSCSVLCSIF